MGGMGTGMRLISPINLALERVGGGGDSVLGASHN
jgi:hypothetical protein